MNTAALFHQVHMPISLDPINALVTIDSIRKKQAERMLEYCDCIHGSRSPGKIWRSEDFSSPTRNRDEPLDVVKAYHLKPNPYCYNLPHWHYVGIGLSLVHTLGHKKKTQNCKFCTQINGFAVELTFRLKCGDDYNPVEPPEWPVKMLQAIASYILETQQIIKPTDHFFWNKSLDGSDSQMEQMIIFSNTQIEDIMIDQDRITFLQIVGVLKEELAKAREWKVYQILNMLMDRTETGGKYLVTDMRRDKSVFDYDPSNYKKVEEGIAEEGSMMAMMCFRHKYYKSSVDLKLGLNQLTTLSDDDVTELTNLAQKMNLTNEVEDNRSVRCESRISSGSEVAMVLDNDIKNSYLEQVYLLFDIEAARIFPIVIKGRLKFRRRFVFQTYDPNLRTYLMPEGEPSNVIVTKDKNIAYCEQDDLSSLHIFISDELQEQMLVDFERDFGLDAVIPKLPKHYKWPKSNIQITIVESLKVEKMEE